MTTFASSSCISGAFSSSLEMVYVVGFSIVAEHANHRSSTSATGLGNCAASASVASVAYAAPATTRSAGRGDPDASAARIAPQRKGPTSRSAEHTGYQPRQHL